MWLYNYKFIEKKKKIYTYFVKYIAIIIIVLDEKWLLCNRGRYWTGLDSEVNQGGTICNIYRVSELDPDNQNLTVRT